jgi:DNA replication protein DnaC
MSLADIRSEVLQVCGIPKVHWGASWEKVSERPRQLLASYRQQLVPMICKGQGLYLWGNYGRGKSALAAVFCKEWLGNTGQPCYWIRHQQYASILFDKPMYNDLYTVEEWCETVYLLVIDEFQVRDNVAFKETAIEELIRRRADKKQCTIITSNVTPTDLKEKFPALNAVLEECVVKVKIDGPDLREGILAENLKRLKE